MNSDIISTSTNDLQNGVDNPNYVLAQIGSSKYNLKDAVKLPEDEDSYEWIANNILDFHKQICMLYGTINEFCTAASCPKMTAGKKHQYLWSDGEKNEPVDYTASDYIHHLLDWVQEKLDDKNVFPSEPSVKFPSGYREICETISKRLLRVYAHIYHHHSQDVKKLKEAPHMNTSLKHFIYFVNEFNLVSPTDLEPLKEYIDNLSETKITSCLPQAGLDIE